MSGAKAAGQPSRHTQTLDEVRRRHRDVRVIAPARSREALVAAIYLALDAPEHVADNYDALADVVRDLSWLPAGPVRLAWVENPALPQPVQRQVMAILTDAAAASARSPRPLSLFLVQA